MVAQLTGASCNYTLGATLGVGEYGKAIQCTRDEDGTQVVVKQVHISSLSPAEQAEAINEVRVMQELDHLNIVKYIECMQQDGCLYIVMEYCCYGELGGLIASRAKAQRPFTEQEIMFWFVQIALGVWHVHSKNILHRDLKTQNIFISKGGILKLGDFGISRVLNSDTELAKTAIGTPYYLSPEICQDMPYNRKSDVWALGCVLYELATLRRAFTGGSLPALVVKILKGQYPPLPGRYSSSLRSLVDSLLQQDPRVRPSIDAVLRMEYVKGHLARYAQHVIKLTTGQPTQGLAPAGLTAATDLAAAEGTAEAADSAKHQGQQAAEHVDTGPEVTNVKAAAAPKKAGSGGLKVPIPGFLRKKAPQQQQQQVPPVPAAAAQQQTQEQTASLGSRIVRRLSSSGSSSGSGKGLKGFLTRNGSSSEKQHGSDSSAMGSSSGSSSAANTAHSSSLNNSLDGRTGNSSMGSMDTKRFSPLPLPPPTAASSRSATVAAAAAAAEGESEYDCSSGLSPVGDDGGQEQVRQRKKLIGTGWIEQQELALARLQADLAASPLVRGRAPEQQQQTYGSGSTPQAGAAVAAEVNIQQSCTPARQQALAAAAATPSPQIAGRAAVAGCRSTPAACHSNSKPSAKRPSSNPSSRGVSKGGAAASPADIVAAARAARLAERANWQGQQAKAAAEEAVRRAARQADLAAALRDKTAADHKAEEDGAAAVAAHRQRMKAVQPQVHKSQLAELGAAFRQRLEAQAGSADSPAVMGAGGSVWPVGDEGYQLPDAAAVPFGVRLLHDSPGGQAMLLECPDDSATVNSAGARGKLQRSISAGRSSSAAAGAAGAGARGASGGQMRSAKSTKQLGGASSGCSRSSSRSSSNRSTPAVSAAASRQSSKRTTPETEARPGGIRTKSAGRAGPQPQPQQQASRHLPAAAAAPAVEKPWKAGRQVGARRSLDPAVEIFAPYGSNLVADIPQQQQQQQQQQYFQPADIQEITFAGQLHNLGHLEQGQQVHSSLIADFSSKEVPAMDSDSRRPTSPQVVNVLHTIQAALRQRSTRQAPDTNASAATSSSSSSSSRQAAKVAAGGNGSSREQQQQQQQRDSGHSDTDPLELPPEAPSAAAAQLPSTAVRGWSGVDDLSGTAAVPVAQKIEALRFSLEQSLGADAFMLAYRYMTAMHQSPAEGEGGEEAPYEVLLFELLGPEKVHFVHLIHKLLMLENQTFLQ